MSDRRQLTWRGEALAPKASVREPYGDPLRNPFLQQPARRPVELSPQVLDAWRKEQARLAEEFRLRAASPRPIRERSGGMDVFVGGGFDDLPLPTLGVARDYADRYAAQTGRPTRYLPNARERRIVDAIREGNQSDGPVNVVGHSYGGPDAYNAVVRARREGLRVDNLVTLDPVTAFGHPPERGRGAVSWTNIQATTHQPNFTDFITNIWPLSRKPSKLPIAAADRSTVVDANHGDFDAMMRKGGARAVLDRSRAPDELHDDLPADEWNRRRNAAVARRR